MDIWHGLTRQWWVFDRIYHAFYILYKTFLFRELATETENWMFNANQIEVGIGWGHDIYRIYSLLCWPAGVVIYKSSKMRCYSTDWPCYGIIGTQRTILTVQSEWPHGFFPNLHATPTKHYDVVPLDMSEIWESKTQCFAILNITFKDDCGHIVI